MKKMKLLLMLCALMAWKATNVLAQETLPPVTVVSLNYKYFKSVSDMNAGQPVRLLERYAASYDVKQSEYYEDEYENYFISFYIPEGHVLATYDNNGKIIRSAERFKNVALPKAVSRSIANRYPGWSIAKDIYVVNYYSNTENTDKVYKLKLARGDERLRVKTNENGVFIER